jgi:hypothetical protein
VTTSRKFGGQVFPLQQAGFPVVSESLLPVNSKEF